MIGIELFGFNLPLWVFFIIAILVIVFAWKLIKFAIKVLIICVIIFIVLIGLDFLNVFSWLQNLVTGII